MDKIDMWLLRICLFCATFVSVVVFVSAVYGLVQAFDGEGVCSDDREVSREL